MITARRIRQHPEARPFKPFRLFMWDGARHEVPHPEFAWIFGSTVFVGVAESSGKAEEQFVKQLSLLHVIRVEPIPAGRLK